MKQNINIRGSKDQPKVGSYKQVRKQISKSAIAQIEKRSINSASDPNKITTMKHLHDQIEE